MTCSERLSCLCDIFILKSKGKKNNIQACWLTKHEESLMRNIFCWTSYNVQQQQKSPCMARPFNSKIFIIQLSKHTIFPAITSPMEFISKKFKYIKLKRYALSNTKKHFKIRNTWWKNLLPWSWAKNWRSLSILNHLIQQQLTHLSVSYSDIIKN